MAVILIYYVKKGLYPYEEIDTDSKFDEIGLPPTSAFYEKLKQKELIGEEYEHCKHVYDKLIGKTFYDYHLAYVRCDVLLLADIFETFRETCMSYYELDPLNYISAPGLAWDALLLKTKIKLDLITDVKILEIIERQKRGGLWLAMS